MLRQKLKCLALAYLIFLQTQLHTPHTARALVEPFTPSYIISDEEFNDVSAMSCEQVQGFLNERKGILKTYVDPEENKYAAQVMCEKAAQFGINPRLILTMIQKEMALLSDPEPDAKQLAWAAGCGPGRTDTSGFATQTECLSRTLRKRFDNAQLGESVDGVTPINKGTLALYKYTTHVWGNKDFHKIWMQYFPASASNAAPSASIASANAPAAATTIIVDSRNIEASPPIKANTTCRSGWGFGSKGLGGHHLVTPVVAGQNESTNIAVWRPAISQAGVYRVSGFVPNRAKVDWACGGVSAKLDTTNAIYDIKHRDGIARFAVNQEPLHDAWVVFGNFYFNAGTDGFVRTSDWTGEPSNSRWVSIDDAKFEWVSP